MSKERQAEKGETQMEIKQLLLGDVRTNCYIVYLPETKKAAIIDPADDADRIERVIQELSAEPEAILLTHGHFDHMLAASQLKDYYHIPVGALKEEQEVLEDPWKNVSSRFRHPYGMEADEFFEDGEELPYLDGLFRVIATPDIPPEAAVITQKESEHCFRVIRCFMKQSEEPICRLEMQRRSGNPLGKNCLYCRTGLKFTADTDSLQRYAMKKNLTRE